ncbi:MAG: dihydroorotate dehydrogenase electron transfer subunit [Solobacterium sp.]|nr:dihydroorotate dehydrogenase electron transfer subunit [Solobacterium sp.]
MIDETALILENTKLKKDIYRLRLQTAIAKSAEIGQFVQVDVPGFFLRRPISICDMDENTITLVFRVSGQGTAAMAALEKGQGVKVLGPLGNGFPLLETENVLLVGGGIGVPPLLAAAKAYAEMGSRPTAVLGFNTSDDIILKDELEPYCEKVVLATMDGSMGYKGTVMDAIEAEKLTGTVLACGPMPMLKAVSTLAKGYVSLEARMACGFGACMGCVVKDTDGESMRVCKDGPVFDMKKVSL